ESALPATACRLDSLIDMPVGRRYNLDTPPGFSGGALPKGARHMQQHRSNLRFGLCVGLLVVGLAVPAYAQKTTGDITGTVTDSTGAVLPGVAVTAVCTATNLTRTATTDAQGGYQLPELTVCVYRVTTELPGFKAVARDVQVAVSAVTKADFKLEVGAQSETVTVEGVSPLIEFSDKLNNNVDTARITELPLSGRDFNSLLAVT